MPDRRYKLIESPGPTGAMGPIKYPYGWLSPEGEYHDTYDHTEWISRNYPGASGNRYDVYDRALMDGWIRVSPCYIEMGREPSDSVFRKLQELYSDHPSGLKLTIENRGDDNWFTVTASDLQIANHYYHLCRRGVQEQALRVCAWCKKVMGIAPEGETGTTTHGICPECEAKLYKKAGMEPPTEPVKKKTDRRFQESVNEAVPKGPDSNVVKELQDYILKQMDMYTDAVERGSWVSFGVARFNKQYTSEDMNGDPFTYLLVVRFDQQRGTAACFTTGLAGWWKEGDESRGAQAAREAGYNATIIINVHMDFPVWRRDGATRSGRARMRQLIDMTFSHEVAHLQRIIAKGESGLGGRVPPIYQSGGPEFAQLRKKPNIASVSHRRNPIEFDAYIAAIKSGWDRLTDKQRASIASVESLISRLYGGRSGTGKTGRILNILGANSPKMRKETLSRLYREGISLRRWGRPKDRRFQESVNEREYDPAEVYVQTMVDFLGAERIEKPESWRREGSAIYLRVPSSSLMRWLSSKAYSARGGPWTLIPFGTEFGSLGNQENRLVAVNASNNEVNLYASDRAEPGDLVPVSADFDWIQGLVYMKPTSTVEIRTRKPKTESVDRRYRPPVNELARPLFQHKDKPFYHATSDAKAGEAILRDLFIEPSNPEGSRGYMVPRAGYAYISPSLKTAAIHALGGYVMGDDYESWGAHTPFGKGSQYGYIFEVSGSEFGDVDPDEDFVGELLSLAWRDEGYSFAEWLIPLAKKYLSEYMIDHAVSGELMYQAKSGKILLRHMDDRQKEELMAYAPTEHEKYPPVATLAHKGGLLVQRAWKLDKTKSAEIARDGSNVLEIADLVVDRTQKESTDRRYKEPITEASVKTYWDIGHHHTGKDYQPWWLPADSDDIKVGARGESHGFEVPQGTELSASGRIDHRNRAISLVSHAHAENKNFVNYAKKLLRMDYPDYRIYVWNEGDLYNRVKRTKKESADRRYRPPVIESNVNIEKHVRDVLAKYPKDSPGIWYNPKERRIWISRGDWEDPSEGYADGDELKAAFAALPGVDLVELEYEVGPDGRWKEVKGRDRKMDPVTEEWHQITEQTYSGEWWIDDMGTAEYADGDIGDINHAMIAFESMIGMGLDDLPEDAPELIPMEPIDDEEAEWLRDQAVDEDVITFLQEGGDPREWAIEHMGWIRLADTAVELWKWNDELLDRLRSGLYDAWNLDDPEGDWKHDIITIEEASTRTLIEVRLEDLMDERWDAAALQRAKASWPKQAPASAFMKTAWARKAAGERGIDESFEAEGEGELTPEQEQKIIQFVKSHPNLDDDTFHEFAKSIGADPHEAEEVVYRYVHRSHKTDRRFVEQASDATLDREAEQMLGRYHQEPTSIWLYTDMPVKDRVAWAYLAADKFKGIHETDLVERFVDTLKKVVDEPETFWQQIRERDEVRAKYLDAQEWSIETVPLSEIGVYPKFSGFSDEKCQGNVLETAEAVQEGDELPEKVNKLIEMADIWSTIIKFLPPILVPGGTVRGRHEDYEQTKWDIDDGNHRLVAAAIAGATEAVCFVGKSSVKEATYAQDSSLVNVDRLLSDDEKYAFEKMVGSASDYDIHATAYYGPLDSLSLPKRDEDTARSALDTLEAYDLIQWEEREFQGHAYADVTWTEHGLEYGVFADYIDPEYLSDDPMERAKAVFGVTNNFMETGYILADGSLLDFSGKREGGSPGHRAYDHRDIGRAIGTGGPLGMWQFMSETGAIRAMPEVGSLTIVRKPTPEQMTVIKRWAEDFVADLGDVSVEIAKDQKTFMGAGASAFQEFNDPRRFVGFIRRGFGTSESVDHRFVEAKKRSKKPAPIIRSHIRYGGDEGNDLWKVEYPNGEVWQYHVDPGVYENRVKNMRNNGAIAALLKRAAKKAYKEEDEDFSGNEEVQGRYLTIDALREFGKKFLTDEEMESYMDRAKHLVHDRRYICESSKTADRRFVARGA